MKVSINIFVKDMRSKKEEFCICNYYLILIKLHNYNMKYR